MGLRSWQETVKESNGKTEPLRDFSLADKKVTGGRAECFLQVPANYWEVPESVAAAAVRAHRPSVAAVLITEQS